MMKKRYTDSYKYIRKTIKDDFEIGIILGTGLGGLVKFIEKPQSVEYSDIPNFPVSTVESHSGKLIFGKLSGKNVVAMSGRFHYYEGYSHNIVTYPIPVMKMLGVKYLIVSNACGAVSTKLEKADLMIMNSHINLHFSSPLIGMNNAGRNGSKYFYDRELIELASKVALKNGINVKKGCYASVQGPNLETKAEYRLMQKIGADTVGMSTIPEVLVAHRLGIRTLGLSIITDLGFPDTLRVAELRHILESASLAEPKMVTLIKNLVKEL
ncbi:MAG: purine-nucleoside phosphorylase [Bacteroidetes bacterium]|nr:purine-nucleoside phosphorylase [Bacteroidota bacterium]